LPAARSQGLISRMPPPAATTVVAVSSQSNADFLEAHARAGCVGLVGGPDILEKAIRRAQRHQRADRSWARYGHAFFFQGRRPDGHHWIIESDVELHREHTRIGVQENRLDKYHGDHEYTSIAVLDFGVSDEQARAMIKEGLDLMVRRTQYSLRELFAAYWAIARTPDSRAGKNPLAQERALFCSALVQHLFLKIGIDFADEVDTKLTTPEDIAQTKVAHTAYVLERGEKSKDPPAAGAKGSPARRGHRTSLRAAVSIPASKLLGSRSSKK
jgi:hypothetical protein